MCIYERRFQILLDEPRYSRIAAIAQERKSSVAAVIREAIDLLAPDDHDKKQAAAKRILEASPMPVPDPEELKAELRELRRGTA
jgi:hypothetical protein